MGEDYRCVQRDITITNVEGLHARPVMRFVDTAAKFSCRIRIRKGDMEVDGKSPMEMMLLESPQGTVLRMIAEGADAAEAIAALATLVDDKFGEE